MILDDIRKELKKNVDKNYRESIERFFKEGQEINFLGVRTPIVRKISKKYFSQIKDKGNKEILGLCEELLEKEFSEEKGIAFDWVSRLKSEFQPSDFSRFRKWLKKYIKNWGHCDVYCSGVLGPFVKSYPEFLPQVKKWTKSKNRWLRRASAVLMISLVEDKKYLQDIFEITDLLLKDDDDLVQKGYGWLLKEASNLYRKEVFDYVMKNKKRMPRTALRYAIEKMNEKMRRKAMKKE